MNEIAQLTFWIFLIASLGLAIGIGRRPERTGALIMALGAVASAVVTSAFTQRFLRVEVFVLGVDLLVLVGLWWLMVRSTRFWPIWATALQLAAILTHIAVALVPPRIAIGYSLLQGFWAYPIIISLLLGAYGSFRYRQLARGR